MRARSLFLTLGGGRPALRRRQGWVQWACGQVRECVSVSSFFKPGTRSHQVRESAGQGLMAEESRGNAEREKQRRSLLFAPARLNAPRSTAGKRRARCCRWLTLSQGRFVRSAGSPRAARPSKERSRLSRACGKNTTAAPWREQTQRREERAPCVDGRAKSSGRILSGQTSMGLSGAVGWREMGRKENGGNVGGLVTLPAAELDCLSMHTARPRCRWPLRHSVCSSPPPGHVIAETRCERALTQGLRGLLQVSAAQHRNAWEAWPSLWPTRAHERAPPHRWQSRQEGGCSSPTQLRCGFTHAITPPASNNGVFGGKSSQRQRERPWGFRMRCSKEAAEQ